MAKVYGVDHNGEDIKKPKSSLYNPVEWEIIPEGEEIPQEHREYIETFFRDKWSGGWAMPRSCHSTMTPFSAQIWGGVRAFARRVK